MNIVKRVWKAVVPEPCRKLVWLVFRRPFVLLVNSFRERSGRRKVVAWLKANGTACLENGTWEEGASRERLYDIIAYLEKKPLNFMPYEFTKYDYKALYPQIFYSDEAQRFYIVHKNRKIYMKKGMNKEQTARCINALLREQDKESAHCYRLDELELTGDEIVVDAGVAEGFVTTELLDRVKKIYAFDIDPDWLDALKWTFGDTDKVVIVPKGLGETVSDGFTTLDEYFKGEKVDLIKADIDSPGAECEMARGGVETFRNAKKAIICTYHHQNDAHEMKQFFEELGFATKFSKGFALRGEVPSRYKTDLQPPYLRRGVIYATKE